MSAYRVIRTIDILGDEEFLIIPCPSYEEWIDVDENIPYWFDSANSWDISDFLNPEIYRSAEIIYVEV